MHADFSILEKNTGTDSSSVVVGHVNYDLVQDETIYQLSFPYTKSWVFEDSIMTVLDSIGQVERIDTIGAINELSIFKKILLDELADFGLMQAGFQIAEVVKSGEAVIFSWNPPPKLEFIQKIITKKRQDRLEGIIVVDENGKEISKSFYDEYLMVNGIPVPQSIKSYYEGSGDEIFRELQFRNIVIN